MKSNYKDNQSVELNTQALVEDVKKILHHARQQAYTAVNSAMVQAYWLIGRRIVVDEQDGQERADYGRQLINTLAKELTDEFGKGFDAREIRKIRQFYLTFPIRDAVSPVLKPIRTLSVIQFLKATNRFSLPNTSCTSPPKKNWPRKLNGKR